MSYIIEFFKNEIIVACLISWLIAQVLKVILVLITSKTIDLSRLVGSGGMPSSHSSLVSTLVFMTGRISGVSSPEFAVAFALAVIVMYDAANVRREAGEHAKIINIIIDQWVENDNLKIDKDLKELLGHTPFEIIIGAILGSIIGAFFPV
ncbi:MAG: divergent PAP2 family protein [Ruminococcaceae bacterium]|nr:divergent PAP2 family protein [Oscillospiraceae bacterium]